MTTVVAVARDGRVHMAGDSSTNVYDRPITGAIQKITRLVTSDGSEVMVGISGDGALAALADVVLKVPNPPAAGQDPRRWANTVALRLTEVAVAAGVVEEGRMAGSVLLAWDGRVWTLAHSQAIPMPDGIGAIGSGEAIAIGVVDALLARRCSPDAAVREAVRIACLRDRYSDGPIQEETLEPPPAVRKVRRRG